MGFTLWAKELWSTIRPTLNEIIFVTKKLMKNPLSLVGATIVFFFVLISIFAPMLAPPIPDANPYEVRYYGPPSFYIYVPPEAPSNQHPFGLLEGYDIYYGVIWGARTAFYTGSVVLALVLVIGLVIGCIAGYYGGLIDAALMRFTDLILAFPSFFLILILVLTFPSLVEVNLAPLHFAITFSYIDKLIIAHVIAIWPAYARLTRAETIKIKHEDYVESAKAIGCSDFRVITRHVLPNAMHPVLIMAFLGIGEIVLSFAVLSFIGLGPEMGYRLARASDSDIPMFADWGTIVSHSRNWALQNPYTLIPPSLFITCFILGWTLLGDSLATVLDPETRRRLT